MSADPLSYFSVGTDEEDEISDDSDDYVADTVTSVDKDNVSSKTEKEDNLPPPLIALAGATTPEFVTSHIRTELNWDSMVKTAPYVPPKEFKPWENVLPPVESKSTVKSRKPDLALVKGVPHTLAPTPPKPELPKPVQPLDAIDHAVTWSKMYKDSDFSSISAKRPRPEDEDFALAGFCHTNLKKDMVAYQSKHQKTGNANAIGTTFKGKEKRKRDIGQANRDKSYVEEEKRILKQNFD